MITRGHKKPIVCLFLNRNIIHSTFFNILVAWFASKLSFPFPCPYSHFGHLSIPLERRGPGLGAPQQCPDCLLHCVRPSIQQTAFPAISSPTWHVFPPHPTCVSEPVTVTRPHPSWTMEFNLASWSALTTEDLKPLFWIHLLLLLYFPYKALITSI